MSAIWASDTFTTTIGGATTILFPGDQVPADTTWLSPSGQFRLTFQADGNLVLTDESDSSVMFATATDGMAADTLIMQEDGNLVIYTGGIFGTPLWSSGTADHENAYLVLQNDGNLVIYDMTGLQNYAVFTVKPDWSQPITETLEWMTSVTESPNAVEQRMGLRISPRQKFEIGYVLFGPKRTYFDALTMAGGGSPLYLPLWHDCGFLDTDVSAGASALNIDTRWTEFQNCNFLVLMRDEFNYELAEIDAYTDSTITLGGPLNASWPLRTTRVYPVKQVYVESQPSGDRFADRAGRFRMRFTSMEPNRSNAVSPLGMFFGNYVLETEPNEDNSLRYSYDRKMYIIDEKTSIPMLSDVAPFILQTHAWFAHGRQRASQLRGLLYALMGRRVPIWVPSFYSDFELIDTTLAADTTLHVKRCGYTDVGGPFNNREYILIHMRDGTRLYRKIVAASIVGAEGLSEDLVIDSAPTHDLTPDNVLRISFLSFSRLDQDSVELTHHTSSKGVTTSNLVFRTDPGIAGTSPPPPPPSPIVDDIFRRDDVLPPGTYYWEITLDEGGVGYVNWGIVFGVCSQLALLSNTVDASVNSPQASSEFANFMTVVTDGVGDGAPAWGYPLRPTGFSVKNAVTNGQVYSVAVNTITHKLWWRAAPSADVRWNADASADPATDTGGIDISSDGLSPVIGNLYAIVGATIGASIFVQPYDSPSKGTINFGTAAFSGTPPSGFIAPSSLLGTALAKLNTSDNSSLTLTNGNLTFEGTEPTGPSDQGNLYDCCRSSFSIAQAP